MTKYFSVNAENYSIRCKIYANEKDEIRRVILFGHGFGGHKDNKAAERFAKHILEKNKHTAVITFNWPCHGDDARKKLRLEECMTYLRLVISYIHETWNDPELFAYGTSFGGYLFLYYILEEGSPFVKIALRCPAVNMYESLTGTIMTEDELAQIRKGKPVLVGFDRKISIDREFLQSLEETDIQQMDFLDYADDILIVHGTKDEIVPYEAVNAFAEENVIELIPVEGADHRFQDPLKMDLATAKIAAFFGMR